MTNQPTTHTDDSVCEVLIERTITFRNSTFGALKTFIRAHKRSHGVVLTNAAAVDMIVREHLARIIHPDAVRTMLRASRPAALQRLKDLPQDDDTGVPEAPQRGATATGIHTPPYVIERPRAPIIDVGTMRVRPFLKTPSAPSGEGVRNIFSNGGAA